MYIYVHRIYKPWFCGKIFKNKPFAYNSSYLSHKLTNRYYSSDQQDDIDTLYHNLTSKRLNYYEILGISPKSSEDGIKRAFIALAKQYHPDICQDTRSRFIFMNIKEAYDKLQDSDCRKKYDRKLYDSDLKSDVILTDFVDIQFESLETELARLNRYKRYVDDERNDIENDRFFFLKIILGTTALLGLIVFACVNLPKLVELEAAKSGKSDVLTTSDFSGEKIVTAFYNPFTKHWERVIDPFQVPTPTQLIEYYKQNDDEGFKKLGKIQMPQRRLTILKTTYQATSHPSVLYDPYRKKLVQINKQK